jgi:hypothetical protein
MASEQKVVRLAGAVLDRSRHVCAFFHTPDEKYQVLLPFIEEGFTQGDKAFHIVDARFRTQHLGRLERAGIDIAAAQRASQIEVCVWEEAYLRGERFDQDAMLALIEQVLTNGKLGGFHLTRLLAEMEWALQDRPGVEDLLEYETRLNYILPRYDDAIV